MTRRTLVLVGAAAGSLVQGCSCGGGDCSVVVPLDGGSLMGFSRGLALDAGVCGPLCGTGLECSVDSATSVRCSVQCIGGRAPPGLQTLSGVDGTAASWLGGMGELDATLRTKLTVAQRRRLSEAREQALLGLSASPVPEAMRRTLGLPDADASRALVATLLH